MKLNKDTRDQIKVGTLLTYGENTYQVLEVITDTGRFRNGHINITVKAITHNPEMYVGCIWYYQPLFSFYGYTITNTTKEI